MRINYVYTDQDCYTVIIHFQRVTCYMKLGQNVSTYRYRYFSYLLAKYI